MKAKGLIELKDCLIQDAFEVTKIPFSFTIITPGGKRDYFLYAENQQEMDDWVIILNEKISMLKHESMEALKSPNKQGDSKTVQSTPQKTLELNSSRAPTPTEKTTTKGRRIWESLFFHIFMKL